MSATGSGYVETLANGTHPLLLVVDANGNGVLYEGLPQNVDFSPGNQQAAVSDQFTGQNSTSFGDLKIDSRSLTPQEVDQLEQSSQFTSSQLSGLTPDQVNSIIGALDKEETAIDEGSIPYDFFQQNCETAWKALCDAAGIPAIIPADKNGNVLFWPGAFVPLGNPTINIINWPPIFFRWWDENTTHHWTDGKPPDTVNTVQVGGGHWEQTLIKFGNTLRNIIDSSQQQGVLGGVSVVVEDAVDADAIPTVSPIIDNVAKAMATQRNTYLSGHYTVVTNGKFGGESLGDGSPSGGNQLVFATGGGNTLNGAGNDVLVGGIGTNKFSFGAAALTDAMASTSAVSTILDYNQGEPGAVVERPFADDFTPAEGDTIDVSGIVGAAYNHGNGVALSSLVRAVEDPATTFIGGSIFGYTDLQVSSTNNGANWVTIAQLTGLHFGEKINVIVDPSSAAKSITIGSDPTLSPVPIVTGVSPSRQEVTAGQSVTFTVTLSQAVTVNTADGTPGLIFNDGTIANYDAAASNPGAGSLVFDYTYTGGTDSAGDPENSPDLTINDINNEASITAVGGGEVDLSLLQNAHTGLQTGAAFVTSVRPTDYGSLNVNGDMGVAQEIKIAVTFSEAVRVTGASPTLVLNDGATATYDATASSPSTGELVFDYTAGASDYTTALAVTSLNAASVVDANGLAVDGSGAKQTLNFPLLGLGYGSTLDVNVGIVSGYALSVSGEADVGQTVKLTLTMSKGLTVTTAGGAPTLTLNDGGTATYDAAASNPASGIIVFDYTVGTGQTTSNLSINRVNLPSGTTIKDAGGNNVDFTLATDYVSALQIGPTSVSGVSSLTSGGVHTGQTVQLAVTLSNGVTVNTAGGPPTLTLSNGGTGTYTATYDVSASLPSAGKLVFDYTVGSSDQAATVSITHVNLPSGTTIKDAGGVSVDLSGANNAAVAGLSFNSALTVTSVQYQAPEITLTLSEPFTLDTSEQLAPELILNSGGTATYDSFASNPSAGTLAFTYFPGSADNTPDLEIMQVLLNGPLSSNATNLPPGTSKVTDTAGNNADFSGALNVSTGVAITARAPLLSSLNAQVSFTPGGSTVLSPNLVLADASKSTLQSAFVALAGASLQDGDVLSANTTGSAITAVYDSTEQVLYLSGTDTLSDYENVLRSVAFSNSNPDLGTGSQQRTVSWEVNDGSTTSTTTTTLAVPTIAVETANGIDLRWATLYNEMANSPIGTGGTATQYTCVDSGQFNGQSASIKFVVTGTGFTYSGSYPNIQLTGGTITGVQVEDSSNVLATFTGLSISATAFQAAMASYVAGGAPPNLAALNAIFLAQAYQVTGGAGLDKLQSGNLNDTFVASTGNDTINGGGGSNAADYSSLTTPGIIAIVQGGGGTVNKGGSNGVDTLASVQNLVENGTGRSNGDVFEVDSTESITANSGNFNYLIELSANVNLSYGTNFTGISEYVGDTGTNTVSFANDPNFAYLYGSTGNDTLTLGSGGGYMFGEGGTNILNGGANATNLFIGGDGGSDTMNGGSGTAGNYYFVDGNDQVNGAGAFNAMIELAPGVTVQLGSSQYQDVQEFVADGGTNVVTVANTDANFVYLYGGSGNDTLSTGSGGGYLIGEGGTNVLNGGGGLNVFVADGASGVDTMNGGTGNNVYFIDGNSKVHGAGTFNTVEELQQGVSLTLGGAQLGTDVQEVVLDGGTNTVDFHTATSTVYLYGGSGNDTLIGGTGNDFLYGGAGTNTFGFQVGWGRDTIMDWASGTNNQIDLTALASLGVHAISDLNQTITNGSDVITSSHTGTNSITLNGFNSTLSASSFHFA